MSQGYDVDVPGMRAVASQVEASTAPLEGAAAGGGTAPRAGAATGAVAGYLAALADAVAHYSEGAQRLGQVTGRTADAYTRGDDEAAAGLARAMGG
ncbi:hypothetical protein WCD74_01170 [Actinomycetospora sp. OC33-EN08]|uniref:ESX-1 secretion-associated protein n=1 Tax=Actinomycetospora aurantiaca TaxID=3129233 RepID=A0ABU8MHE5_9PSEU